ncbi:MAG: SUMF1/EgtB/PvdO family nonheme iron enzyme [Planctomycetes bacterium]|nr:SUMF1/EgtB/PvdO family nonheme iron enzyme [Planctomycetota bacterium]MCB9891004.1 SUMF1/EgtB/PvdO family nonheme iron enzyme [Planctomycetota bacterium]MCB9919143.1 SUMF1/EgtB/PvdO family nonheme iron enzyme [Planctomycetota bacterium]
MDPKAALDVQDLEERAATAFLERLVVDLSEDRRLGLASYLAQYPAFEARIAHEWLLATGTSPSIIEASSRVATRLAGSVGPYRLVRELGHGGQGTVYLAEDTRMPRTVALKVLTRELHAIESAGYLRFRREAAALARLDDPGIATVYEVGEDGDVAWIAMSYVRGGSLQDATKRRMLGGEGPPIATEEIARTVRIIARAARALQVAHRAGIVHRDIKPANILLATPERPVLVDFGLAHDEQNAMQTLTVPGAVLGTLCYLPPERLAGGRADACGDIYGLGACLYEALTLDRPFSAATTAAELRAIATEELRDVRRLNPRVGRDLAIVVSTALAKDPTSRYRTAEAFADDLDRVAAKQPVLARSPRMTVRLLRFCERERGLAAALAALFVLLIGGLATVTWLWRENRTALASITRLADLKLALELRQREESLWPEQPDRVSTMLEWLADANRIRARVPEHITLLASLAPPGSDETADWQRDQLLAIARELADLEPRMTAVRERVERASTLAVRTLEQAAGEWKDARARVRANPLYRGLLLAPQLGLVPLGPDPESRLEEFAHVQSGTVPRRSTASGKLEIIEESAVVLVLVPGGEVVLGADRVAPAERPANVDPEVPDEQGPSYVVTLDPYFLGKYELTQAQWRRHAGENPSAYQPGNGLTKIEGLLHPVELVTWVDADRVMHQLGLRLPTEAQWERAYRAGTATPYPYGPTERSLEAHENLADRTAQREGTNRQLRYVDWLEDGHMVHAPVGSFAPNAFGLFDMGGNVKEWCDDSWENYADVRPRDGDGRRRGAFERYRVVRGGCFSSDVDQARAAARFGGEKDTRGAEAGLRAARDVTH